MKSFIHVFQSPNKNLQFVVVCPSGHHGVARKELRKTLEKEFGQAGKKSKDETRKYAAGIVRDVKRVSLAVNFIGKNSRFVMDLR
jgi:hypothetical protein